jgi:hypothetical protein
MDEHNFGDQVMKQTSVVNDAGKPEKVIDVARGIWGDNPPPVDTTKPATTVAPDVQGDNGANKNVRAHTDVAAAGHADATAHARSVRPGVHSDNSNGAGHGHTKDAPPPAGIHSKDSPAHPAAIHAKDAPAHPSGIQPKDSHQKDAGAHGKDSAAAQAHDRTGIKDRPHETQANHEKLAEASHKIKLLNNELHKPGGPLAGSPLELVGFDTKGRLLLIDRDKAGKVEHKYLVDSESGKVVARTEPGHLDKWQHGPGYDRGGSGQKADAPGQKPDVAGAKPDVAGAKPDVAGAKHDAPVPKHDAPKPTTDTNGAKVLRDSSNRVREIVDAYGDKRQFERNAQGHLSEITITLKGQKPEHFKPGGSVADVSYDIWYKQPHNANDHTAGFKFDVKDDGSLVMHTKSTEFTIYQADGGIVEHNGSGKEKVVRKGYGVAAHDEDQADNNKNKARTPVEAPPLRY